MFKSHERSFLERQRIAHFATANEAGQPHVVPVCYAVVDNAMYFSIDEKPKRDRSQPLKRIRNIAVNPQVALVIDRYDEDWQHLAWVMVRGRAEVLYGGDEHSRAQDVLISRYPQLGDMKISELAVVKTNIEAVVSWGAVE